LKGLKFPHRAVVLLVLESDGACTGLNGRSARKCSVLVLVWCYIARGQREQNLQRYKPPEICIKKRYDKPSGYGCPSNKCEQGEQWSNDLAALRALGKHSDIQSENTSFEMLWLSPLTWIHIAIAEVCVYFTVSVINIHSCHQDMRLSWVGPMEYHPHTGFHYSKVLTYLSHDYVSFINISCLDLDGIG
jgi:hypothetical protein